MTRDRYQTRLARFLDFIGIAADADATLQERAKAFAKMGKQNNNWA
jgi:hypothetical protein